MNDDVLDAGARMPVRYLIHLRGRGTYLGRGRWTEFLTSEPLPADAPTFDIDKARSELEGLELKAETHCFREVIPDRPGDRVSPEAVSNTGLPRWQPGAVAA